MVLVLFRLLAWFCYGVDVVLLWCWYGFGIVWVFLLVLCCNGFGIVVVWCWYGFGMVLLLFWYGVGMVSVWCWYGDRCGLGIVLV